MDPIKFDEANLVLTAPPTMKDDCGDLYCHTTGDTVISKWKLTRRERLSALINGTCWVHVYTGKQYPQAAPTHPPLALDVRGDIFGTKPIPESLPWWKRQLLKLKYF